ncbi:MAG: four helix bundle protein [Candidatus Cloacimonetes bacterium]|nr:four helix bundle protein [Candidatus Cloacimonadota bacterium]
MSKKEKNKENNKKKFDLQDRLIDYAVRIIKVSEQLPDTKAGKYISSQMLKSGISPAPNYGEAQSAESRADFVHKLKVALKELRETEVWLKIIVKAKLIQPSTKLFPLLQETEELISILFKSIDTAKKKNER